MEDVCRGYTGEVSIDVQTADWPFTRGRGNGAIVISILGGDEGTSSAGFLMCSEADFVPLMKEICKELKSEIDSNDPSPYISQILWVPFNMPTGATPLTSFYVGKVEVTVPSGVVVVNAPGVSSGTPIVFTLPIHPQAPGEVEVYGFVQSYLQGSKYTTYTLDLPIIGTIPLPNEYFLT